MKTIRLENNIVVEIIPDYALPVTDWYGANFASQCIEASDEVKLNWIYNQDNKTFTDPTILTIAQIRENKLDSLNGMCSGAIYKGIDIGTLHYNFTDKTQVNLETIARMINDGQTTFLYRADNETEQRNYIVDEMKVIIKTKSEWITVNTNYYEILKKWVNRETDETILNAIRYGSTLPNDLMQELVTKSTSVGIDITKYATVLGGE
jgi:hypothetical protein